MNLYCAACIVTDSRMTPLTVQAATLIDGTALCKGHARDAVKSPGYADGSRLYKWLMGLYDEGKKLRNPWAR